MIINFRSPNPFIAEVTIKSGTVSLTEDIAVCDNKVWQILPSFIEEIENLLSDMKDYNEKHSGIPKGI